MKERKIQDECGVFGIYGVEHAASLTYYGLHALQHRGQEGCGIISVDEEGAFHRIKGKGLVTEVFKGDELSAMRGNMAIGHVLYTAAEGNRLENVQPLMFHHKSGDFAIANNGCLVNAEELRSYLENRGSLFQSTSDSEILAHLIKKERSASRPRIHTIIDALNMMEGAFTFMVMTSRRIYACRDQHGLRPSGRGVCHCE